MTTVTIDRKILEDLIGMVEAETDRHRNRRGSAIKAGIASRDAIVAKAKEALGPREVQYTAYAEGRQCAMDGWLISANPYRDTAPNIKFFDWEQGWIDFHNGGELPAHKQEGSKAEFDRYIAGDR